jgi:hypothetical protein
MIESANLEPAWLTPRQVLHCYRGRICLREIKRRLHPGDPDYLRSRPRLDGKPGQEIDPLSMDFDAQKFWRSALLQSIVKPKSDGGNGAVPDSPQLYLLPQTEWDRKIAALDCREQQRPVILGRFRAILPLVNHDYKALGHASKESYIRETAQGCGVSRRTVQRWLATFIEHEDLRALANEDPGPEAKGAGSQALNVLIDIDGQAKRARAFIKDRWLGLEGSGLPNKKQIYGELIRYLTEKQRGCGLSYAYRFPSESTVYRFIDELDQVAQAERQGPDAVKAALGYMDRTYTDLHSLERIETDEWKTDVRTYDERRPRIVRRWWLLTFYDARAIYPLSWELVAGNDYDVRHGIAQEDEINLLVRLVREYGVPGALHSDRGRFRGMLFGGRPLHEQIDSKFAQANGILDQLGIQRNMLREKNPRGTRLERFHRYLADCCRRLPGWIGSNTRERKETRGDADEAAHKEFVAGRRATTPLLSRFELFTQINQWMEAWREHPSEGTDMRGLSPKAVFVHNAPAAGFRKISEEELAWVTAQHFQDETIEPGGIVTLPDGKRYSHPLLALIQGETRECVRLRDDHSQISVLPAAKGEETVIAPRRVPVGASDPAALANASEFQSRLRKLQQQMVEKRESEVVGAQHAAPAKDEPGTTSDFRLSISEPEPPAPSLYDLGECTVEKL